MPPVPLCVVEAFGGYAGSGDVEGAQERPQRLPEPKGPSISMLFRLRLGKTAL